MRGARKLLVLGRNWPRANRCPTHVRGLSGLSQDNILRSPYPDVHVPDVSVDQYIWRNLDRWTTKTAVVCAQTGRQYTYGELHDTCGRIAQGLRGRARLQRGDVMALHAPNIPDFCAAVLGAFRAGIVVSTFNPIYTPEEIVRQLRDSGAKAVVTMVMLYPAIAAAMKLLPEHQRDIPVFTIKYLPGDVTPEGAIDFCELCSYNGPQVKLGTSSSEDLVLLPYSSGTTGLPKGVELSHRNIVANLAQIHYKDIRLVLETTETWQDRVSAVLPLYHIYGLVLVFLNAMNEGCQLITMPRFTPEQYHAMIIKHKPTMLYTAPPIVLFLNNFPAVKPEHLGDVRRVMCGAAPLAPSDIQRFNDKFQVRGESKIIQGYGLTESSPLTHTQRASADTSTGGIGWAIPNTECRIISLEDDRTSLGPGATGQLAVRGPQVMRGYRNNPQATADTVDAEGWLRTGDIAHFNDTQQFHITDRLKELIKVKGFQVAPAELEGLLRDHPDIVDAAVTGIPNKTSGQVPKAFVVRRPGCGSISEQHVQEFIAAKVSSFKRLTGGVVFVDSIPKNPSGKILRRVLKDM